MHPIKNEEFSHYLIFFFRFCVGDRFYLWENKILCEYDYQERKVFANMKVNPASNVENFKRNYSPTPPAQNVHPGQTAMHPQQQNHQNQMMGQQMNHHNHIPNVSSAFIAPDTDFYLVGVEIVFQNVI